MPRGCLALFLFVAFIIFLPLFFAEAIFTALAKLGLTPYQSLVAGSGIFLGGLVNIPIRKFEIIESHHSSQSLFGLNKFRYSSQNHPNQMVLAINLGGGLIPAFLACYQFYRFGYLNPNLEIITAMVAALLINIAVCYKLAKPIKNVGIALNAFIPAVVATLTAVVLMPQQAPALAFTAGVGGPLIGADLLHLNNIKKINAAMVSIGGAGTFDGIVLAGIIATLLA